MSSSALTVIHKLLRVELFQLSIWLGRASPTDGAEAAERLAELAGFLRGHAAHEDAALLPALRRKDPALAGRMAAGHEEHEIEIAALCATATALTARPATGAAEALARLHLDWNRFVAGYLVHLDEEERLMLPVLGEDAPGLRMVAGSLASMPADAAQTFRTRLRAAIPPAEFQAIEAMTMGEAPIADRVPGRDRA